MSFKNGREKTGGRQKGSTNKDIEPIRAAFTELVTMGLKTMKKDLMSLEPKDRLIMLDKFSEYCIPKQQRIEMKAEITGEIVTTTYTIGEGVEITI